MLAVSITKEFQKGVCVFLHLFFQLSEESLALNDFFIKMLFPFFFVVLNAKAHETDHYSKACPFCSSPQQTHCASVLCLFTNSVWFHILVRLITSSVAFCLLVPLLLWCHTVAFCVWILFIQATGHLMQGLVSLAVLFYAFCWHQYQFSVVLFNLHLYQ